MLDPNTLSPDGSTALMAFAPSPDGRLLAYTLAQGGADWQTVHVRDLQTGRDLDDRVRWMRFSGLAWTHDSRGFFYSRFPEPPPGKALEAALANHALYYHRLGTSQDDDRLIYARPDLPSWFVHGTVSDEGGTCWSRCSKARRTTIGCTSRTSAIPTPLTCARPFAPWSRRMAPSTRRSARPARRCSSARMPRRRTAACSRSISIASPPALAWSFRSAQETLGAVALIGGRLVAEYLVDVQSRSRCSIPRPARRSGALALPGPGVVSALDGRADTPTAWLAFTSPLQPAHRLCVPTWPAAR